RGETALKELFALMRTDKTMNRLVLPKSYSTKAVDDKGKKIERKDTVPYSAVIEKSAGGEYFRITISPDAGVDYVGPRELYFVEKKTGQFEEVKEKGKDGKETTKKKEITTVQLRAKYQIEEAKIKFNDKEKAKEAPSKEAELADLLAIIENEGENGFKRYSRSKIDRKSGKPVGPGQLKQLMKDVCGNEAGNDKLIQLPNGYSVFSPQWDESYGKPERIIMKGSRIIAMQMQGGNLKYAHEIGEKEDPGIARRSAEVMKSRAFLPKILGSMRFRGEGEFQKPYFASIEDMNHMKDVLVSFAKNARKDVDQLTLNYNGGMTVHYEKNSDGNALFTMKFGDGFTMYFDTSNPNKFGLPAPDGNGYEEYSSGEFIPTPEEENQARMRQTQKRQDELKRKNDAAKKVALDKIANDKKNQGRAEATKSLTAISSTRKDVLQKITSNMGKMASIATITDTWPKIADKAKGTSAIDDVVKHPDRYTRSSGKFIFKIKDHKSMSSAERQLIQQTKIQDLLQLQNGPLKDLPLRVTIVQANGEKVRGVRYPGDKTVYALGKPKNEQNRLRVNAGDEIKVTILTEKEFQFQEKVTETLKKRDVLVKSVSKKKSELGEKLKEANTRLSNFIKSHSEKTGGGTYQSVNLLDSWPNKIKLAKYVPLMEEQIRILKDLDKSA
ncbi:hypothetical protein KKD70_00760, partial [Patescibacteria group bacterium]|nr:hypothetical protein [Patescibacteria group bacterium]